MEIPQPREPPHEIPRSDGADGGGSVPSSASTSVVNTQVVGVRRSGRFGVSELVEAPISGSGALSGVVDVEVKVAEPVVKRKRGRPPKNQAAKTLLPPPPPPRKKDEEDVCFICFDGGSLVLCDRR